MSFPSQNTPKSMSARASPQTPIESLSAPQRPLRDMSGIEGREGLGEGNREEKGEVGGIAPWLLGEQTSLAIPIDS